MGDCCVLLNELWRHTCLVWVRSITLASFSANGARSMLYRGADLIRDIEWVIFDEVHYVNDAEVCVDGADAVQCT
jgi:antiviral helicase SKI2